jgi:hypothetical protein
MLKRKNVIMILTTVRRRVWFWHVWVWLQHARVEFHISLRSTGTRVVLSFLFFSLLFLFSFNHTIIDWTRMREIKNKLCVLNPHAAGHFNCTVLRVHWTLMRVKSTRKVFFYFNHTRVRKSKSLPFSIWGFKVILFWRHFVLKINHVGRQKIYLVWKFEVFVRFYFLSKLITNIWPIQFLWWWIIDLRT